jgi:hypothetical protein
VIFVEGNPPDWLAPGDEADFFNAEANGHMLVVSWTGEEVEYYYGGTISRKKVAETFGLPHLRARTRSTTDYSFANQSSGNSWLGWVVVLGFFGVIAAVFLLPLTGSRGRPAPPAKQDAPEFVLPVGVDGTAPSLGSVRIAGLASMEIGELGARFDRHEYFLRSPNGFTALLIDASAPGSKSWLLLRAEPTPTAWTPAKLAALRVGQPLNWAGTGFRVTRIQASRLLVKIGDFPGFANVADQRYGLLAQEGSEWLFARWSETELTLYRGRELSERDVKQAFGNR